LFEIKQQWQINKITVTPQIVSAMGVIPGMLNQNLTTPTLMPCLLSQVHKVIKTEYLFHCEKIPQSTYVMKRLIIPSNVSFPRSQPYTLISLFPVATPSRYLVQTPYSESLGTPAIA